MPLISIVLGTHFYELEHLCVLNHSPIALSHWCIFHRGKAELVVATWDKQFHDSEMAQKVPLLYLANDILQNSKRKGNEFVSEFWKVLPSALKDVLDHADNHGKNVISRLVDIWEHRKVFVSRTRSLKDVILGEEAPPPLAFSKKRTRSVRIVKRDSRSIRTKLSIGSAAEKIVSAFYLVLSECSNEETEMTNCNSAVQRVRKMENTVDVACSVAKNPQRNKLAKELEEEESILKQCIEKLQSVEANRMALISHLKEALHVQESELENIRTQMQVAQAQAEDAKNMQNRLNDEAIAAEVADKLAASSSSQMIMTSVLSTFAAEEAKNTVLTKTNNGSNAFTPNPVRSANSITKPEASAIVSDPNVFMSMQPLPAPANHSYQSVMVPQPAMQSQAPNSQTPYQMLPNTPSQPYMQLSNGVLTPYGYGRLPSSTPVPPPPIPRMVSPMVSLTQQMLQQPMPLAQQPSPMIQTQPVPFAQQPLAPSFRPLQPPGMVYYGHLPPSQ
ncbi:regulation of nuclear pre-mRNA domain-containing protein 1B-like isoform X3 [Cucurbita pepo subsp. pepo]|uniref:regulation of nuclear pre-mRNA domain-containing protein 1B-like isoform X3 n=1 Tax=Cucurbita pepo subsp. pepo TaxID=3664 RepID=UPI000C9D2DC2|nr:regulation of nuclear pre-mRNA domain-containing protein 1B-like isoform X3 [Cucurbita pepo subsp. pepo]